MCGLRKVGGLGNVCETKEVDGLGDFVYWREKVVRESWLSKGNGWT